MTLTFFTALSSLVSHKGFTIGSILYTPNFVNMSSSTLFNLKRSKSANMKFWKADFVRTHCVIEVDKEAESRGEAKFLVSCCFDGCKHRPSVRPKNFSNLIPHFLSEHEHSEDELKGLLKDYYKKVASGELKENSSALARAAAGSNPVNKYFPPAIKPKSKITTRQSAFYDMICFVVDDNVPFTKADDENFRSRLKYGHVPISSKSLRGCLYALEEIVEKKIAAEISLCRNAGGKAQILHDGWSRCSQHFIGVFISFMLGDKQMLRLLACGPMAGPWTDAEDYEEKEEATNFTATTHKTFIEDTMGWYGLDNLKEFVVCQCADQCAVNLLLARLLKIPHVCCNNHLLQNETKKMVEEASSLKQYLDDLSELMKSMKTLKNRAVLRAKTNLAPKLWGKTRWTSIGNMIARFKQFVVQVREAANEEDADITIEPTLSRAATNRYNSWFGAITSVVRRLQTRGFTLSQCITLLEELVHFFTDNRIDCPLVNGTEYISLDSEKRPNSVFERAVCKIQQGEEDKLTDFEKRAVIMLRKQDNMDAEVVVEEEEVTNPAIDFDTYQQRKKPKLEKVDEYIDLRFILGSAAEVERLWSLAKHVFTDGRSSMYPRLFEAIMMLRANRDLWNLEDMEEAIRAWQADNKEKRLEKRMADDETQLKEIRA